MIEAISSGIRGSSFTTLAAAGRGIRQKRRHGLPHPMVFSQTCCLPRRQFAAVSAGNMPFAGNTVATSGFARAAYIHDLTDILVPMVIGVLIVFCDRRPIYKCGGSVPHMDVFLILISTSFTPIDGKGTSSIQIPFSGRNFTNAFIIETSTNY
jgi:hypothetical protein